MRIARFYQSADGQEPFVKDVEAIRDLRAVSKIWARISRAEAGNLGDWRSVGGGVIELRIHDGPGYRLYVGIAGNVMIILLCAGDKSTQAADIRRAQAYWTDYRRRH